MMTTTTHVLPLSTRRAAQVLSVTPTVLCHAIWRGKLTPPAKDDGGYEDRFARADAVNASRRDLVPQLESECRAAIALLELALALPGSASTTSV
jgi:hypothetical protein